MRGGERRAARGTWRERNAWFCLSILILGAWGGLFALFEGILYGLIHADCARVSCTTGPDAELLRFSCFLSAILATLVGAPLGLEWTVRLRTARAVAAAARAHATGTPARDRATPSRSAGSRAEYAPPIGLWDGFGEIAALLAARLPLRAVAVLIFVLDLIALVALFTMTSSLLGYSSLMGYPVLLGWMMLTMVVPVLTLQYLVFSPGAPRGSVSRW